MKRVTFVICLLLVCMTTVAQPSVTPTAEYTLSDGSVTTDTSNPLSAPVRGVFRACPDLGDYKALYEWKIFLEKPDTEPLIHRSDEDIEYTFTKSGTYYVQLQATFKLGDDVIEWPEDGAQYMSFTIAESKLEFPNAFSPNGDGKNDTFHAKEGYQSIVEFEAAIYSRQGVKLYSWTDLAGSWDGRYKGRVVHDGVYYLVVKARGADGVKYNIRRAVNVLTGTREDNGAAE